MQAFLDVADGTRASYFARCGSSWRIFVVRRKGW